MAEISRRHFEKMIRPNIRAAAEKYVRSLLADGVHCAILSSTNRELVAPVAEYFGISEFHGTVLELQDGRFTGRIAPGEFFAGAGKVMVMQRLCSKYGVTPAEIAAYGDSINDAKLLTAAGIPHAVSPSNSLRELAEQNNWRILDWRA
jgi:phosphoserine phosphatase